MNRRELLTFGLATAAAPASVVAAERSRRISLQEGALAGFQYHDGERAWPALSVGDGLGLRREAENPYDRRAVAVWWREHKLGYVPRRENVSIAHLLDGGERLEARITALRVSPNPWQRVSFEVVLRA